MLNKFYHLKKKKVQGYLFKLFQSRMSFNYVSVIGVTLHVLHLSSVQTRDVCQVDTDLF